MAEANALSDNEGMKAQAKYPIDSIVIEADGHILVASNGQVSGPPEMVKRVKEAALLGEWTQLTYPYGEWVQANLSPEDVVATAAALVCAAPGRSTFLSIPISLLNFLDRDVEENGEHDLRDPATAGSTPSSREDI